jgi:hypothetical protein
VQWLDERELLATMRVAALLALAATLALMVLAGIGQALAQQLQIVQVPVPIDPLLFEHRFTTLETALAALTTQVNDLRNAKWVELAALSGLVGETGLRTLKARAKKEGE